MYAITPMRSPSSRDAIDDSPIVEFNKVMETTKPEQWEKRTKALKTLVNAIPQEDGEPTSSPPLFWYESPKYLRHLSGHLSELLKDPRSSVVKRTCDSLVELFDKCRTTARYLLKDLMPTIVGVHAQTVHIIRTYVFNMMNEVLPKVPCKATMPLWLEKLKSDKSRTIREACANYLLLALQTWTSADYLTFDIWNQVGTMFIRALRDPYPSVRSVAKTAVEFIRTQQPEVWDALVNDPNGPAAKDSKLQTWLWKLGTEEDYTVGDLSSVGSRASLHSTRSTPSRKSRSIPTNVVVGGSSAARASSSSSSLRRGLGPPVRNAIDTSSSPRKSSPPKNSGSNRGGMMEFSPQQRNKLTSYGGGSSSPPNRPPRNSTASTSSTTAAAVTAAQPEQNAAIEFEEFPFLQSMEELKKQAKSRKSRRSLSLQERFRLSGLSSTGVSSSSLLVERDDNENKNKNNTAVEKKPFEEEITPTNTDTTAASTVVPPAAAQPEHIQIALQLLEAHRRHVDQIMETLRLEMDSLRDLEILLQENRAKEEDVLDYFESVGLCLDQRTSRGKELQREMDLIANSTS